MWPAVWPFHTSRHPLLAPFRVWLQVSLIPKFVCKTRVRIHEAYWPMLDTATPPHRGRYCVAENMHRHGVFCVIAPILPITSPCSHGNWWHNSFHCRKSPVFASVCASHGVHMVRIHAHHAHITCLHRHIQAHMRVYASGWAGAMRGYVDMCIHRNTQIGFFHC